MDKSKEQYNPFDTFLFWLDLVSVDYGFTFYESLKDGMITSTPEEKHKETE
ncbi:hypothetical protein FACS189445_6280 [Spirochaetia bacterium]|nr:hypothetical protein FACS189445_6280 [Spirochaetia bacterium]